MNLLECVVDITCTLSDKLQTISMAIENVIIPYIFVIQKFIKFDNIQTVSNKMLSTQPLSVYVCYNVNLGGCRLQILNRDVSRGK